MTSRKLTVKDLLDKKDKKMDVRKELFINSLEGSITIRKPDRKLCLEALEMANSEEKHTADLYLLYNCIVSPNVKDKELHGAYRCHEPYEIIEKIFEPGEIADLSGKCIELAGFNNSVKMVDDIKN